jgi:hypothetical protein
VISALAAGADQLVARAALAQGWHLESVLPFARDDYANDLSGADLAEFRALLDASASVLELDGKRAGAEAINRAYEAAGLVALANSDIVIAIWDQKPAEGRGGTALIVNSAIEEGIPVVLLDPAGRREPEHQPKLIWTGFVDLPPGRPRIEEMERRDALSEMKHVVESLILPPPSAVERGKLRTYLAETEKRFLIALTYPLLFHAFSDRKLRRTDVRHPEYLPKTLEEWRDYLRGLPPLGRLGEMISEALLPSYAFADKLAVIYAQLYRSAFTFNYLAASVAVTLALTGIFYPPPSYKVALVVLELLLILAIWWRTSSARKWQWHRRWLEYRRLAEELRHQRVLAPLGGANRFRRPPSLANNKGNWIDWLLMINARALPLPNAVVDRAYLDKLAETIRICELVEQIEYNATTSERMHKVEASLHLLGTRCFVATAVVCGLFLVLHVPEMLGWHQPFSHALPALTTFLTAFLPTMGAALSAIRGQGDFESWATRTERTKERLERIANAIKPDAPPPITLARLADYVDKAAEAMSSDLDEWQILSTTKPVSLPA